MLLIRFDFGLECDRKAGPQQIVRIRKLQPEYYCLRLGLKFITTADITADLWKYFTVGQNERKFKPVGRIGLQAFLASIPHFIRHLPPHQNRIQLGDLREGTVFARNLGDEGAFLDKRVAHHPFEGRVKLHLYSRRSPPGFRERGPPRRWRQQCLLPPATPEIAISEITFFARSGSFSY